MSHHAAWDASKGMADPPRSDKHTPAERARAWFDAAMEQDRPAEFLGQHAAEDPPAIDRARRLIEAASAEADDELRPVLDLDDLFEDAARSARLLDDGARITTPAGPGVVEALLGDEDARRVAEVYRVRLEGGGACALKVLRASTPDLRARFRREAAALARLEHPGIARLLSAGVVHLASGERLPAIAMQLIEGEHLDAWARGRPLSDIASAVAFAARAVHYAHLRGVLHRDIKPANIVVDQAGRPMLLDLGVARLIEGAPDDNKATLTGAGHAVGTPQYMAPEQLTPTTRPVDLRCDVYALGLVLHELITGEPMVDVAGLSQAEALERKLAATAPPPRGLSVRDQLLTVARCAASPDPDSRHDSANAFADDVDRALHGRPLLVRPPGRARRALLFVRRNWVPLLLVLTLALALATIAGMRWTSQREIRLERDRAEARFDETRAFARWVIFELGSDLAMLPGSTALRSELIGHASDTLDRLAADPIADDGLLLELAEAYTRLSEIQVHEVGDMKGSVRPLDRAATLLERLDDPGTPLAEMLDVYLRFRWFFDVNRDHPRSALDKSANGFRPILERMVALEPAAAGDARYWRWRSMMHWFFARRLQDDGAAPDAVVLEVQQRAIEDAQRAVELDRGDPLARAELASAWFFRAYAIAEGDPYTPEDLSKAVLDALSFAQALDDEGHPRGGYFVSRCLQLMADAHARQAQWAACLEAAEATIRAADRSAHLLPNHILVVRNAEVCRIRLAANIRDAGPDIPTPIVEAALAWGEEAMAMLQARRARGWLGPVEDGRYDDLYAQVIEDLRARLAAQVPEPAQPDTQR
ncbi:MAG: protein kinase [Phycisphaerales bacterium]